MPFGKTAAAAGYKKLSCRWDSLPCLCDSQACSAISHLRNLAAVYRPPSSSSYIGLYTASRSVLSVLSSPTFWTKYCYFQVSQSSVVTKCPGRNSASIDQQLSDMLTRILAQSVSQPTHDDRNVLDLLITTEHT